MLIAKLRQIAQQRLPLDVSNDDEVDELRVLMAAGLITALTVRVPYVRCSRTGGEDTSSYGMSLAIRVLAITPDGRRLLRRSDTAASGGATSH